jgi:quercetin dioxygenase-like cupin family protein
MFLPIAIQAGLLLDLSDGVHPTQVFGWNGGVLSLPEGATHYGMVTEGEAELRYDGGQFRLRPGMYFVLPSPATLSGPGSRGLVVSRLGDAGLPQWGGPVEARGRLRYIDGCSDTLLVCPPQKGEPCLNHLHIPPHTRQSAHTHSSERVGVILRGAGECRTEGGVFALAPGMGWCIPAGCLHSFFTTDSSLDVIAWHPDSDFGPTHDNHPMVNLTLVDGVSAAQLPAIQTGEATL